MHTTTHDGETQAGTVEAVERKARIAAMTIALDRGADAVAFELALARLPSRTSRKPVAAVSSIVDVSDDWRASECDGGFAGFLARVLDADATTADEAIAVGRGATSTDVLADMLDD